MVVFIMMPDILVRLVLYYCYWYWWDFSSNESLLVCICINILLRDVQHNEFFCPVCLNIPVSCSRFFVRIATYVRKQQHHCRLGYTGNLRVKAMFDIDSTYALHHL